MKKRVFLVEDHPIVRQGLTQLLNQEADLEVCGEALDAGEAFKKISEKKPDIALVDLSLGEGISGLQLIKDLKKAGVATPVLVLSMHEESIYAERVIRAGARGYVMKAEVTDKVLGAIRKILSGDIYLSEGMVSRMVHKLAKNNMEPTETSIQILSDRETEVFHLIGSGHGTREIAGKLNLSIKTIESYREHIKEKLHLKNATELVQFAAQWIQFESKENAAAVS
ncbi:MAG: response regulator transcription factor [Spirochaetia bacterium]|nr:response regulator transcription factor [Spirochaetia bacterium]